MQRRLRLDKGDAGASWSKSNEALPVYPSSYPFGDIVAAPGWGVHTFFAASTDHGIFKTTSDGE